MSADRHRGSSRSFVRHQKVLVKNVRGEGVQWMPGVIRSVISLITYLAVVKGPFRFVHADHLRSSEIAVPQKSQLITASPISPVQVTVFYEALCPDSRSFFIKQLIPTFEKASRLVDIALVPYGKAKTEVVEGGGYSFMCQHGPIECEANKIHACAVVKVRHEATRLQFIACMIADNLRPTDIGQSCAGQWNIAWEPILECATGSEGSDLLKRHGDATDALNPKATFIPTILLDQSQERQPAILKDLFKEVCHELKNYKAEECQ
ncbi:unnamed protein product [Timema podura]|uniref:Gamma-interferon-inducible lysosomal thiol reductase n=1 Tax=Timema podura TaxID=61482 RepID=A0ABN7NGC8_TIMPD|nr:unnamed protein product [Timema podura]